MVRYGEALNEGPCCLDWIIFKLGKTDRQTDALMKYSFLYELDTWYLPTYLSCRTKIDPDGLDQIGDCSFVWKECSVMARLGKVS